MKKNKDISHFIVSNNEHVSIKLHNIKIENSNYEKLLAIKIDSKLFFKGHYDRIIKKASQKVNALSCVAPYMNVDKRRLSMNSFFASQFNCCPLSSMCNHCSVKNKASRLHERCLRIVYRDGGQCFTDLLDKYRNIPIYVKNMQPLTKEMFKVSNNLSA